MTMRGMLPGLVMAALCGGALTPHAQAESLRAALSSAYSSNPEISSERARLKATDEGVSKARAGWRPKVIVNGSATLGVKKTTPMPGDSRNYDSESISITLSQPIFDGFKTGARVRGAKAAVRAGQQNLLAVEQKVLLDAATAYMNVVRDREIVRLRKRNITVLREQLEAVRSRFSVGEVTRTDVSQARAALAQARAAHAQARAALAASRASYEKAVGQRPGRLVFPRRLPRLPRSLAAALKRAERLNPQILAAAWARAAAEHNIMATRGDLLPSLDLQAQLSATRNNEEKSPVVKTRDARIMATLKIPLYQGGFVHASVREAKHNAEAARLSVAVARRAVRQQVMAAWSNLTAARQVITSSRAAVDAARLAYNGVREEYKAGSRTTLDVLNARQTLLDARVSLISARASEITAAYALLAAIGELTAHRLRLSVAAYDAAAHYRAVKSKWIGTGD